MQPNLTVVSLNELSQTIEMNRDRFPHWRLRMHGKGRIWRRFGSRFTSAAPKAYWRR